MIGDADRTPTGATPGVILIADDLTGAADSGVTFAQQGETVMVLWDPAQLRPDSSTMPQADVLVISTESRHGSPEEAERRVAAFMAGLSPVWCRADRPWFYKKIDSTLRGHPGVELAAILRCLETACPEEHNGGVGMRPRALVAPAFPAQGRVTRGGCHFVHGTPLAETVFGQEVPTSRVSDRFREAFRSEHLVEVSLSDLRSGSFEAYRPATEGPPGSGTAMGAAEHAVLIADAENDGDLALLVRRSLASGIRVLCGSAGLANALAQSLSCGGAWRVPPEAAAPRPACAAVLVVAASRHPQTRRQLHLLRAAGIPIITPPVDWLLGDNAHSTSMADALAQALEIGVAVLTTDGLPHLSAVGADIASRLAEAVAAQIRVAADGRAVGLVLTGGDAAIAVSRALGVQALRLSGEVAPGVPWGILQGGWGDGIPVVTKAGGFGEDDALLVATTFLRGAIRD